jgi:hypothetical protein
MQPSVARRAETTAHARMFRSRILRILLVVLGLFLFVGFFAFSTLLYNPLEGGLEADVAALVPRDADFFCAKADLGEVFGDFPRLAAQDRIEKHPAWQTFLRSPEYAELDRSLKLEATLAEIRKTTSQLPLGYQPLDIFGGRDLAVAGKLHGRDLAQADWAVYGRANWIGKLAAALLRYPNAIGLAKQNIQATVEEGLVSLKGGQLQRELFVTRIRDVVVVATNKELAQAANGFAARGFVDSFFQSAEYADYIQRADRGPKQDELEFYLNTRKLLENLQFKGPWPDTKSQDFLPAFLGRLFQLGNTKAAIGVLDLDEKFALDLHGDLSSELITPEQSKLYRTRGFDRDQILLDVARLAPADTSLFLYGHAPMGDLLRMMLASAEPALKKNLEDAFRNTGRYQSLDQLVNELDASLKDRFALIVRPNDYPPDPDGPPHNAEPVPAVMLVLWTKNTDAIHALRELIGNQGAKFGLQGRTPNEPGFFKNTEAGFETREYWSRFVPGTGIVVTGNRGELTIVTNTLGMLGHVAKTYDVGGERYPRLAEDGRFSALVSSSLVQANVLVYANPATLAPILRAQAQQVAEDSIQIDWRTERARVEEQVIRETFPGRQRGTLSTEEQKQLEAIVDPKLESIRQKVKAEQVPAKMAEQERKVKYLEAISAALVMLKLDPKRFDLSVRMPTPLPPR